MQTLKGGEALRAGLGPLGQKYIETILRGTRDKQKSDVNYVYGVYLHKDGLMFGNKRFDVDDTDNIIIDGVRYVDTPGLYELIFKRIPDDSSLYRRRYKQIQKHASGDERVQIQASIAGSIIERVVATTVRYCASCPKGLMSYSCLLHSDYMRLHPALTSMCLTCSSNAIYMLTDIIV